MTTIYKMAEKNPESEKVIELKSASDHPEWLSDIEKQKRISQDIIHDGHQTKTDVSQRNRDAAQSAEESAYNRHRHNHSQDWIANFVAKNEAKRRKDYLHYFDFSDELKNMIQAINRGINLNCQTANPEIDYDTKPKWINPLMSLTTAESDELSMARQQLCYRESLYLSHEHLKGYKKNPYLTVDALTNAELRRKNSHLIAKLNSLPDLTVVSESDTWPYLKMLDIAKPKRKRKSKAV